MLQTTHESYTGFSAFNTVDRDSTDTERLLQRNTGQQGPLYVTSQSQETISQWKEALSSHYGVSVRLHRIPYSFMNHLWIILQLLDKLNLCEATKNRQIKVFSQNVCWITKEMI